MKNFKTLLEGVQGLLTEATVNDLISDWQDDWISKKKPKTGFWKRPTYSELEPDEKIELDKHIKKMKEDYIKYVDNTTDNKQYKSWIFKLLSDKNIRLPEDIGKVKETLEQYTVLKRNPNFKKRDILSFNTYSQLAEEIDEFTLQNPSKVTNIGNNEVVYEKDNFKVLELIDYKDSVHLLKPTKWCVKFEENFENYLHTEGDYYNEECEKQPFYLFLKDDLQYALLHLGSNQLKDVYDKSFKTLDPEFEKVLSEIIHDFASYGQLELGGELTIAFNSRSQKSFNTENADDIFKDAIKYHDIILIKKLIELNHISWDALKIEEFTELLDICIQDSYVEGVKEIFESDEITLKGITLEEDVNLTTAMITNIAKDSFEPIMKLLLDNGYLMKSNEMLYTVAKHCVITQNTKILEEFLKKDNRPDFIAEGDDYPVTMKLVRQRKIKEPEHIYLNVLSVLYKHGAEVDSEPETGRSFIEFLCDLGYDVTFEFILKQPHLNPNPLMGKSPLMYACHSLNVECVELALKSSRIFVNHKDEYGNTALHHLFVSNMPNGRRSKISAAGTLTILNMLLKHGANPNITNNLGKPALYFAKQYPEEYSVSIKTLESHMQKDNNK